MIDTNTFSPTSTMRRSFVLAAFALAATLLAPALTQAGEGHDHGDATPVAAGPALPRFSAVSEDFELVGVLSGKQITLYLDRAADNAPVNDAQIELEISGAKLKAQKHDDSFEVVLAVEPKPGVLPITATVIVGNEVDLLASELDIHEEAHTETIVSGTPWTRYMAWIIAAGFILLALLFVSRRMAITRSLRTGDVA